jgi:hypothetical protein
MWGARLQHCTEAAKQSTHNLSLEKQPHVSQRPTACGLQPVLAHDGMLQAATTAVQSLQQGTLPTALRVTTSPALYEPTKDLLASVTSLSYENHCCGRCCCKLPRMSNQRSVQLLRSP